MTKEFFEIVLSKLINQRDMIELDIKNLLLMEISSNDKSDKFISLLGELTDVNNYIESLTGMLPDGVITDKPQYEENNNN